MTTASDYCGALVLFVSGCTGDNTPVALISIPVPGVYPGVYPGGCLGVQTPPSGSKLLIA